MLADFPYFAMKYDV